MAKAVMLKVSKTGTPSVPNKVDFDVRDRLAELVGRGNNLSPDDKAGIYGDLVATVGEKTATKIMNHAYIFNQRGDIQSLPLEERLKSLYTIGSNDPDVLQVLNKSKSLGYGVIPGLREGSSAINQELTGRMSQPVSGVVNPQVRNKVMLRVNK